MTIQTFASLMSCLGSAAIVTSLIFVIRNMRLNMLHQQSAARYGRVQQMQTLYLQASQGDLSNIVMRGMAGDALDSRDCTRFIWFANSIFNMFENMYNQHRDRIIGNAAFAASISAMRARLALPGIRAAWMVVRGQYQAAFADYVDGLMADTPAGGTADNSEVWQSHLKQQEHVRVPN